MPMYDLIEYSNTYSETSGTLWQYYRDEPALNASGIITDFPANNNNGVSFKFKTKITDKTEKYDTKNIMI